MNRLLAILFVLACVTACGVPVENAPHPVSLPGRSGQPSPDPTPPAGSLAQTLYLVKESQLVPVERGVPVQPDASAHLQALLAGPTAAEKQQGLSSALLGTDLGLTVKVTNGQAIVELATGLEGSGRTDDILAFAQIVCTLTSRTDITIVTFTRDGQPVEVPRADGSLALSPLTASDYASLTAPRTG